MRKDKGKLKFKKLFKCRDTLITVFSIEALKFQNSLTVK